MPEQRYCVERREVLGKSVAGSGGAANAHHEYLFTNRRPTRIKVLVSDEFGLWLIIRPLFERAFHWQTNSSATHLEMTESQFDVLAGWQFAACQCYWWLKEACIQVEFSPKAKFGALSEK